MHPNSVTASASPTRPPAPPAGPSSTRPSLRRPFRPVTPAVNVNVMNVNLKKQDSGLILPLTLMGDDDDNDNDTSLSAQAGPLPPVTLSVSNLSLNLGTVPLPIPRKLAPLSRPSTASSRSSASSSSSSSSPSQKSPSTSDPRPASSSADLASANANGPSLARTMADLDLALRASSWQHIPGYLAHLRTLLSGSPAAKDWLARNGLAQLVRVAKSLNAVLALDHTSVGLVATLNLARLASAALFSTEIRASLFATPSIHAELVVELLKLHASLTLDAGQAAAGARLMYAVGTLTETLSEAHEAAEPWIEDTIRVLAHVGARYLEMAGEAGRDKDVWEWLVKTIRCLANLFQSHLLGTCHAHNNHLSILIDLLEFTTATVAANESQESEELQLNLLLLLNNVSFYPPPPQPTSSQSTHFLADQSTRLLDALAHILTHAPSSSCVGDLAEAHIEALGVLANLVRMPASKASTIMTESHGEGAWPALVEDVLDAAVQAASADVLVPLCGVWTNLVGSESEHGMGDGVWRWLVVDNMDSIVDVLSIAIESGSEPLVRVWSRLLMNVLVAFHESEGGIDEVRGKVALEHVDEVGAYLDEAERKGIKGVELVKEVMDKLVEMDLGPEVDDGDACDLEPLPEP